MWSQVSSLLPPGSCLQFLSRIYRGVRRSQCSSIFHRVLLTHSRSRAFRKTICTQQKVPTNLYKHALGGIRTHETGLYTRLEDNNLTRHKGDQILYIIAPIIYDMPCPQTDEKARGNQNHRCTVSRMDPTSPFRGMGHTV